MNLLELILKNIRQRSLSTVLTILSITLGVALAISIQVMYRESRGLFGQTDYGYEVLAGVKGSGLQLVVNTVYRIDRSPGNIPYATYENIIKNPTFRRDVRLAVPQAVGDSYNGQPIVGTTTLFFGFNADGTPAEEGKRFEYRPEKSFEFAQGRVFAESKFEAVIGSDVSRLAGLKLGDKFKATHGFPQPGQAPDVHDEEWEIVGVMAPTHTANDKCIYIGLTSFYTIFEHGEAEIERDMIRRGENPAARKAAQKKAADGHDHDHDHDDHKHYTLNPDGTIELDKEVRDVREISALLIKARSGFSAMNLTYNLNLQPDVMAVNPATVMREFFGKFVDAPVRLLLVISAMVTVVAAIGIMTTIYNSVAARKREIAILRALGATQKRILLLITSEAALIGLVGAVLGFVLGHAFCAAGSAYMERTFGESIAWHRADWMEAAYLGAVVVIAAIAGLVPALKAYATSVADNLVAE